MRCLTALRPDLCLLNVHLRIDTFARVHTVRLYAFRACVCVCTNNFSIFYDYLLDVYTCYTGMFVFQVSIDEESRCVVGRWNRALR